MEITDTVIIGSGIAALSVAVELCTNGKKVIIITKKDKMSSNSSLAQGGISVALAKGDTPQYHLEDTLEAGCYLNDKEAVKELVTKAPDVLREFIGTGMCFDSDNCGRLHFGKEGAHRLARIIHAGGDRTGLKVVEHLFTLLNENVVINENETAVELRVKDGKCNGVITKTQNGELKTYQANNTVLATGGIGQLYPCTTNDETITGDGVALAYRAGCELENLEFIQFHPTLLSVNGKTMGLVSEAVRGEGGILINEKGEKIMESFLPYKDLSPRDVVSREVYAHSLNGEQIYLDISDVECFKERFPTVTEICKNNGVSVLDNRIPISPGAHFYMGGVKATPKGETNVNGLFAVGEVACTGVHGANRLASNSLLEGLVFGKLTAENIIKKKRKADETEAVFSEKLLGELPTKNEIRKKMMQSMGIVRTEEKISELISYFEKFMYSEDFGKIDIKRATLEQLEIYNMITVGWLSAKSGFSRKESIGAHYIK